MNKNEKLLQCDNIPEIVDNISENKDDKPVQLDDVLENVIKKLDYDEDDKDKESIGFEEIQKYVASIKDTEDKNDPLIVPRVMGSFGIASGLVVAGLGGVTLINNPAGIETIYVGAGLAGAGTVALTATESINEYNIRMGYMDSAIMNQQQITELIYSKRRAEKYKNTEEIAGKIADRLDSNSEDKPLNIPVGNPKSSLENKPLNKTEERFEDKPVSKLSKLLNRKKNNNRDRGIGLG
jgi:hypothetical protein